MVEQIGHYRVVRELGRGAMGVVYLAYEESLNRTVALKVLASHLTEDPELLQRFQLEARSLGQLNHRNIVQIYYVGEDGGRHFFAMEHVPKSLQQLLRDHGSLDGSRAAQLVLDAVSGLAAAHERGIVHRDVKPANLLIGEDGILKVADFGIARMAAASTRLTATDMLLGTPHYISPEQCEGEDGDQRSDVYSLGVTYYEMLSGKAPFQATHPLALLKKILLETPPPIEEAVPGVDARTRAIVGRMMAKDPAERYQSAREVAADLQAYLRSHLLPDWDGRSSVPALAVMPSPPPAAEAPTVLLTKQISPPAPPAPPGALPIAPTLVELPAAPRPFAAPAAGPRAAFPRWAAAVLVLLAVAGLGGAAAAWMLHQGDPSGVPVVDLDPVPPLPADPPGGEIPLDPEPPAGDPAGGGIPVNPEPVRHTAGDPRGTYGDGRVVRSEETIDRLPESASSSSGAPPPETAVDSRLALGPEAGPGAGGGGGGGGGTTQPGPPGAGPAADPPTVSRELRGVAVVVSGDDPLLAGALEDYLASELASEVELLSAPSAGSRGGEPPPLSSLLADLGQRAKQVILARTVYLGERQLYYLGRQDTAYQSRVTLECYDTASDRNLARWSGTVEYTAVQTERAVGQALRKPTAELVAALRQ